MRFLAILNRGGGTLRTTDLDAFVERMRATLAEAGHELDVTIVKGKEIEAALADAAKAKRVDVVIAGGGDGTISAAAAAIAGSGKALAVLPAGTMNLYARSLGIPLDLDQAIAAFADGEIREVDVATVNGRIFVHQYSVGMHAKLVKLRESMNFRSRLGKIWASVRAGTTALLNPPSMTVEMEIDGSATILVQTSGIGVSNNLFGEGHLPYADDPAGGTLGIYVASSRTRWDMAKLFANIMVGRWDRNPHIEVHEAQKVVLRYRKVRARHRCVIDGELSRLEKETVLEIRPGSLRALMPRPERA